jgi:hypothetical protein
MMATVANERSQQSYGGKCGDGRAYQTRQTRSSLLQPITN